MLCLKTTITENGQQGKGHLKNNMRQGKWTSFKNGNLNSIGNFSQDKKNGKWKYFYSNRKLHQKGKYIDDKQNGIWNYYFDSGEFMGKGQIIDNKQNGLWKWFHKNGKLYTERFYASGRLMKIKSCYDKKGNEMNCGKIIDGSGIMLFHDIENETDTIQKFEFENGIIKN
ncbi:hypothetical protein AWB57_11135 [Riemerella anatipestifer]|nr:hypothetical protein [Riemerella anatipestifer]AZZ59526.1 hypothetical protein AWB57_11135 [Riemerella anatipestifer]MDR7775668.1 hypothetical protein [Riemerella anatipestifer]MRM85278.1 hypothetical protein [Riemerella anatipestifer]MRQ22596.1 hypothetical protein [Riemerella anatipestifer]UZF07392.1 hypothetical protein D9O39_02315 [Riemerella anatipestifer]